MCNQGNCPPVREDFESETFDEGSIFNHIRRKAKTFPLPGNLKTTEFKNMSNHFNCGSEGIEVRSLYEAPQDPVIISHPDDMRRIPAAKGVAEQENFLFFGNSRGIGDKTLTASKSTLNISKKTKSYEKPAARIPLVKRRLVKAVACTESYQPRPSSQALPHRQSSLFVKPGEIEKENSFLGFKSVFSFL